MGVVYETNTLILSILLRSECCYSWFDDT